jgi:MYXO-CTERM domain-containing protein
VDEHKRSESARWRSASVAGALAAALAAVVLDQALGRSTSTPSDLSLFVGRFHPLVVHLPIGIFLLVGAAELGTTFKRLRARIDPALPLILPLMVLSALSAFLLGHMLAHSGGFPPQLLLVHRRLALCAVLGSSSCLGAWTYHARVDSRTSRGIYRVLLALSLGALSVGAHFGGAMTHGDTYLSKYAPALLKPLLGGPEPPVKNEALAAPLAHAEPLLFEGVVLPILRQRCVECHGAEKTKGKLRLDSLEGILKGGEHGAALVSGNAEGSLMLRRMLLPVAADEHMPPQGKPGPLPGQIAVLRFWIERGASPTFRVRDALAPPASRSLLEMAILGQTPTSAASEAQPTFTEPEPGERSQPSTKPASALEPATGAVPAHAVGSGSVAQILSAKCETCHSGEQAKGGLRLNSLAAALEGSEDGPVVVPGNPDKSPMVRRIQLPLDDEDHMPPVEQPQLAKAEIAAIVAWVRTGAKAGATPASHNNAAPEAASDGKVASAAGADHGATIADGGVDTAGSSEPPAPALPAHSGAANATATAEPSAKPAAASGAPPQTLRTHPGGCGACAVGSAATAPLGVEVAPLTALALLAAWRPIWRRRNRARSARRRSRCA